MRLTEFWQRMTAAFGAVHVEPFAEDHVLRLLDGRTVRQALADGVDAKDVWRAVCEEMELPTELR